VVLQIPAKNCEASGLIANAHTRIRGENKLRNRLPWHSEFALFTTSNQEVKHELETIKQR